MAISLGAVTLGKCVTAPLTAPLVAISGAVTHWKVEIAMNDRDKM